MTPAEFLATAARTPFQWGVFDCSLMLADWVKVRRGFDPAAHLRGRYRTALGCARVLRREGGVLGVVRACAAIAGLDEARTPCAGDVGVVAAITADPRRQGSQVGAICTGSRWAVLGEAGLIVAPMVPLAAWRV